MPPELTGEVDVQLLYGPPPVLPDVEKQLKEHLLHVDQLPIHNYENAQQFWPRQPNPTSLYHFELSPLGTTLKVDRDPTTGKVLQFREVPTDDAACNAKNSMSLRRAPGPSTQSVRGTDANYPFWPGGFPKLSTQDTPDDDDGEVNFEDNLLHIAPGLGRGILFQRDGCTPCTNEHNDFPQLKSKPPPVVEKEASPVPSLMDIIQQEENLIGLWKEAAPQVEQDQVNDPSKTIVQTMKMNTEEELEVIPEKVNLPILKIAQAPTLKGPTKAEWAEVIDVSLPVTDFDEKIPKKPINFEFELDPFQKQAIMKLEEHSNVFVAAHTSAGKTVVAEYAIALSQQNMTRTVYTSPIKALSNQKFRDFKGRFSSVGLITGDMQLNPTASCLIMTTEILRSMLYQGSEVVRDLEFVIFDEVHYINNIERGHVWEEALILLPETVCIIMLSATVPNTLEFANWVGRTKQRKMYVISTPKRPVPLQHYLYTGSTNKQKKGHFLILDADGKFSEKGFHEACEAKESLKSKAKGKNGPRPMFKSWSEKQEATMWQRLINHLETENLLPVVAFTLSRNRCDSNAKNLSSVDLIHEKDHKHFIKTYFNKCLQRLKEPDRELPQVQQMASLLDRGLGVHHSGILPILKEIVEILFQKGLVKVLFATETFAMGVNMPARTVVFDSIRKFDGQGMRELLPAEYIQMAGRAGRRLKDSMGTVYIVCKMDVPKVEVLRNMMLGKPEKLTSQFRLTYAMILRLLRVEKISVEDMMSRSFMEFGKQTQFDRIDQELQDVEDKIAKCVASSTKMGDSAKLSELFKKGSTYIDLWTETRKALMVTTKLQKDLTPGRVVLVNHMEHINKLGMLLSVDQKERQEKTYNVLVLCNDDNGSGDSGEIRLSLKHDPARDTPKQREDKWCKMMALIYDNQIFVPDGLGQHTVLTIKAVDIAKVVREVIAIDPELILNDFRSRQIPRFRDRPPGTSCLQAIQELTRLSLNASSLSYITHTCKEHYVNACLQHMAQIRDWVHEQNFPNTLNFQEQFEMLFERMKLEERKNNLRFSLSNKSMQLYPDYVSKVEVLKEMGYIEKNNAVEMKGRVAIKMRNNELIITELVLRNILKDMPAPEIAALLSALVFQQKTKSEPKLPESLQIGIKIFSEIQADIQRCETKHQVEPSVDHQGLNFGLVGVVYEWAKEKPFAEIVNMTDVQEGIVVRCIQQLNDTLRDVKDAATSVGDTMLSTKMDEASRAIKRDIVFAASLYTSDTPQE